jgi:hypothetical protein
LTYWSCQSGLSLLSSHLLRERGLIPGVDEGKLKNFFGRYTDHSLKALSALVGLYCPSSSNHLYLAEAAQRLTQAVKYDIPQLKKLIHSSTKQQEDLARRMGEEGRHAREVRARLAKQLAEQWGVASIQQASGSTGAAHLSKAVSRRAAADVPELLNEVLLAARETKVGEALDYYRAFVKFTVPAEATTQPDSIFPTVQAVRAAELLPLDELKDDSASSTAATSSAASSSDTAPADGIDWGISVEGAGDSGGSATIDWGITSEGGGEADASDAPAAASIDWGIEDNTPADGAAAAATIDWGIETTESGSAAAAASPSPAPVAAAPASSSPGDLSADAPRHAFLSELLELESFLQERVHDLSSSSSSSSSAASAASSSAASGAGGGAGDELAAAAFQGSGVPHVLTLQSAAGVGAYLAAVRRVLGLLRAPRLTQVLLLRSSSRAVDRQVSSLRQSIAGLERLERGQAVHEARRTELARLVSKSALELQTHLEHTRTLKKDVETAISALFQHRPVQLTGEIHQALA